MVTQPYLKDEDLVYQELKKYYQENFMFLTQQELTSLMSKQNEYKELLKKAEVIIYIM